MGWISRGTDAYKRLLERVMPSGPIWGRLATADLDATTAATADELARVDGRIADLAREADPREADETMDAWDVELGLPDPADPSPPTALSDRQAAAHAALIATGGQSIAYYTEVAAALGVVMTINERPYGNPFVCGISRCGDRLNTRSASFYWQVVGPSATGAALQDRLEALITRLSPAHTLVEFDWSA